MMINKLKKFEDYLIDDRPNEILRFGEYRKGSNEYGDFIQELMMFLRNYKKDENNLIFKIKELTFDVNKLYKLSKDENKKRLISFNIYFKDENKKNIDKITKNGYVLFSGLNKKFYNRPWEKLNINEIQ